MKVTFPNFNETMVTVPMSFQYNLGNQHGIPSKAKEIRQKKIAEEKQKFELKATASEGDIMRGEKPKKKADKTESEIIHNWEKAASGQFAEQKVYDMLQMRFSNSACLLVHEFKENDLIKVIRENLEQERRDAKLKQNKTAFENDLTQREFQYFKLTNRHFYDLEKQITEMMDPILQERFFEDDIPQVLVKIKEHKPGYEQLTESRRKSYIKNIEDFLKKKFKEGAIHTKSQLQNLIFEHLLNLTYPNSEYDLLLFLKVCTISTKPKQCSSKDIKPHF